MQDRPTEEVRAAGLRMEKGSGPFLQSPGTAWSGIPDPGIGLWEQAEGVLQSSGRDAEESEEKETGTGFEEGPGLYW